MNDYSDGYFPHMASSQSSLSEHPLATSGTLEPDAQASQEPIMPTQLKAKVNFDDNCNSCYSQQHPVPLLD